MTIAKLLYPSNCEILALKVVTQTVLGLSNFSLIGCQLSFDQLLANSSNRISTTSSSEFIRVTFRFLATPARYFSFFSSS